MSRFDSDTLIAADAAAARRVKIPAASGAPSRCYGLDRLV
jgi:hypothetical protein